MTNHTESTVRFGQLTDIQISVVQRGLQNCHRTSKERERVTLLYLMQIWRGEHWGSCLCSYFYYYLQDEDIFFTSRGSGDNFPESWIQERSDIWWIKVMCYCTALRKKAKRRGHTCKDVFLKGGCGFGCFFCCSSASDSEDLMWSEHPWTHHKGDFATVASSHWLTIAC